MATLSSYADSMFQGAFLRVADYVPNNVEDGASGVGNVAISTIAKTPDVFTSV